MREDSLPKRSVNEDEMIYSKAKFAILIQRVIVSVCFTMILFGAVPAQKTEHYKSPLYSPRKYDPASSVTNGMPDALKEVGIEQKLNSQLPLDALFKDEDRNEIKLGTYFSNEKPVILALVYYECPMLCNEVLNGLTGSLKGINFEAGKDFDVVAISFDAREHNKEDLARNKKTAYLERYNRPGTENGWHFLTGSQEEIDKVTEAVGFNYRFDEKSNQFAHAGGIMIATPEGKAVKIPLRDRLRSQGYQVQLDGIF